MSLRSIFSPRGGVRMVGFLRLWAVLAALCLLDSAQPAPSRPRISRLLVPGLGPRHIRRDGGGFRRLRGGKAEEDGWEVPGHAWDQSRSAVKVYLFIPGIGSAWGGAWEDHVSARFEEQSMDVRVEGFPADGGKAKNYRLKIQLFFPVEADKCTFSLRADRVTVTLPKVANGGLWPKLTKMTRLTLDDIPTLPESFRAEPEGTEAEQSRAGSVDDGQESSKKKMELMASERRVLEGVLAAARDGNVQAMKERIGLACSERSIEARELLDQFKDANGCSAAHMAAAGGHMAVLHYLRDAGADLSGGDAVGHTPLYAAAAAGRHDVARMLASVDNMPINTKDVSSGATALCHAAANGDVAMIDLLVGFGASLDENSELGAAVQWAAMADSSAAVESLLEHGANPNVVAPPSGDRSLPSALVVASSMNQTEICKKLLESGADAAARDTEGMTALHHAAGNGNAPLFRSLLLFNADPYAKDDQGQVAATCGKGKWFKAQVDVIMREWASTEDKGEAYWDAVANNTATQTQLEFLENTRMFTTEEKREILQSPSAQPEHATAKVKRELGNELLGDGNLEGAIQMYTSAIELSPDMKEAYSNRASALMRLAKQRQLQGGDGAQELEKGLKDAQKARELDPEWAKGHYREGQVYRAMGNLPEAGLCFWEALKLDPHSTEAQDMFRRCVDEGRRKAGAQGNGLMSEEEMKEMDVEKGGGGAGLRSDTDCIDATIARS